MEGDYILASTAKADHFLAARSPTNLQPFDALQMRIQSLGEEISQFVQKLEDPTETFATFFPTFTENQIHITVTFPVRSRSVGECMAYSSK